MQIRTLHQLTGSWGLVIQLQSNGSCCCLSNRLTKEDLDFFNLDQICLFSGKKKVHDIYGAWHCQTYFVQILSFIKKRGSEPGRRVDGWGFPQDLWPKGQNCLAHCILATAEFSFHLDTANVSIEPQNHRKIWLEKTSGNNPIHPPAQSRANFNSCSYLYTFSACVQK